MLLSTWNSSITGNFEVIHGLIINFYIALELR